MLSISIPKPCHENWDKMSPVEKGAFCNVCSKVVVDFTSLSDEEVKNYFLQNFNKKTCGRFTNHQLSSDISPLITIINNNLPFWKKFLAIVIVLFAGFLAGCERPTVGKLAISHDKEITCESVQYQTTLGVTHKEIDSPIEVRLITIKGFVMPEIVTDIICHTPPAISGIVEVKIDTSVLQKNLNLGKNDSVNLKIIEKNICDSSNIMDTVYYSP